VNCPLSTNALEHGGAAEQPAGGMRNPISMIATNSINLRKEDPTVGDRLPSSWRLSPSEELSIFKLYAISRITG
jgi:hypothetical protein